jgi:nucleotide-binding universal stress UspA family protein
VTESRKIVLGYDGSESAQRALARAEALAKRSGATIVLVDVVPPTDFGFPIKEEHAAMVLEQAKTYLATQGVRAEVRVPIGEPAGRLVETGKEPGVELIVVGTRSRNLIERLLLGSVSTDVHHHAPCDVLVVK